MQEPEVRNRRPMTIGGEPIGSSFGRRAPTPTVNSSNGGFAALLRILALLMLFPVMFLVLVDILVSCPIDPQLFVLPPPPKFEGALRPNNILRETDILHEGLVMGPESIIVRNGHLYTGTSDGRILHIYNDEIQEVTRLGTLPCGNFEDEPTCGRPLGMRFDSSGYLIVVDAYLGLFKVNVDTGATEMLFNSKNRINGKVPMFLNDLDIDSDGSIYLTDSSTQWDRRHFPMAILENKPDARLLKFTPWTGEMTVLLSGLHFANGVQISPCGYYVMIAETSRCRITKYHLKGVEAGSSEIFIDNLPGMPDNIRASSSGGFWVGLASHRSAHEFAMMDFLSSWPSIRRIIPKLFHMNTISRMATKPYGLILELDVNGQVVRSLHDPKGEKISSVSEVEDVAGNLYLGSFNAHFIGKLDARNIPSVEEMQALS